MPNDSARLDELKLEASLIRDLHNSTNEILLGAADLVRKRTPLPATADELDQVERQLNDNLERTVRAFLAGELDEDALPLIDAARSCAWLSKNFPGRPWRGRMQAAAHHIFKHPDRDPMQAAAVFLGRLATGVLRPVAR
jgi:hypothetical protein